MGYGRPNYDATPQTAKKGYTGTFPTLPTRGYYKVGDGYKTLTNYKTQIKRVQNFLIWAGFSVGKDGADGKYGTNTANAVKAFQKAVGFNESGQDGEFGSKTLAKAKAYKK